VLRLELLRGRLSGMGSGPARRVPDVIGKACGVPKGGCVENVCCGSKLRCLARAEEGLREGGRDYLLQWGYFIL